MLKRNTFQENILPCMPNINTLYFRFGVPFFLFIFGGQYALRKQYVTIFVKKINPLNNSKSV